MRPHEGMDHMKTSAVEKFFTLVGAIPVIAWGVGGCASAPPESENKMIHASMKASATSPRFQASQLHRHEVCLNCYSLLHELLKEQSQVEKVLWVKLETEDLRPLLKYIAEASASSARVLEAFAKSDPTLRLTALDLPAGEQATRDAIRRTKTKEFLSPFNPDFEVVFLQTEAEALCYAWHLANVAADNDDSSSRVEALRHMGKQMRQLHKEVFLRLRFAAARACASQDLKVTRSPEHSTQNP